MMKNVRKRSLSWQPIKRLELRLFELDKISSLPQSGRKLPKRKRRDKLRLKGRIEYGNMQGKWSSNVPNRLKTYLRLESSKIAV